MKKAILGLVVLAGVTLATVSSAQVGASRPYAASRGYINGIYTWVCPLGWSPVTYTYPYVYTYTVVTGYQLVPYVGPFGRLRYRNVPITQQYTYTVPAGVTYCVPSQPIYLVPVQPLYR